MIFGSKITTNSNPEMDKSSENEYRGDNGQDNKPIIDNNLVLMTPVSLLPQNPTNIIPIEESSHRMDDPYNPRNKLQNHRTSRCVTPITGASPEKKLDYKSIEESDTSIRHPLRNSGKADPNGKVLKKRNESGSERSYSEKCQLAQPVEQQFSLEMSVKKLCDTVGRQLGTLFVRAIPLFVGVAIIIAIFLLIHRLFIQPTVTNREPLTTTQATIINKITHEKDNTYTLVFKVQYSDGQILETTTSLNVDKSTFESVELGQVLDLDIE